MKYRVYVSTGMVGSKVEAEVELPDDLDAGSVEDQMRDEMFNLIDWGYGPVDAKEPE